MGHLVTEQFRKDVEKYLDSVSPIIIESPEGKEVKLHSIEIIDEHEVELTCIDSEGLKVTFSGFFKAYVSECGCTPEDLPELPQKVTDVLNKIIREKARENEERWVESIESWSVRTDAYKAESEFEPVYIGDVYSLLDLELNEREDECIKVTNVYTCPTMGMRMVAGIVFSKRHIARLEKDIPTYLLIESIVDVKEDN